LWYHQVPLFSYLPAIYMPRPAAESLMDEILVATILKKEWNFKRIAEFTLEKQVELLIDLNKVAPHPRIEEKLAQLQEAWEAIRATKL
jgi:hypothetical protein